MRILKGIEMAKLIKKIKISREHTKDTKVRIIYIGLIAKGVDLVEAYDRAHIAIYGVDHKNRIASKYGLKEVLFVAALAFVATMI